MTTIEFEHIVLRIRPKLLRVAFDFFCNEEDAEDAVQNVLFKMWKREWKPDDNVAAFAIKATKNECVSIARKNRLREHLVLNNDTLKHMSSNEADQYIVTEEQRRTIEQAINTLTRSEQRIIRLTQDRGLDAEEIAIVTGMKITSVRSMLSMARKKLIERLKL